MFTRSASKRYLVLLSVLESVFGLVPVEKMEYQSYWSIKDLFTRRFVLDCANEIGVSVCGFDKRNPDLFWLCTFA